MAPDRPPVFRRAVHADIPAMSRIRLSVTENMLSDPGRVTAAMYEDYLEAAGRGWVAESGGEIVAFCYAARADGSIWALFVRPGNEGQGLGKRLLGLAVDWIAELGHASARLETGAHTRADRFYAMQGWQRRPIGAATAAYTLPLAAHPA
ncbi:GNAT family N-acetyltransferase [Massilia sp. GCM10023247]